MEARRKFDAQFKEGAVRIVRETGKPIASYQDQIPTNKSLRLQGIAWSWVSRSITSASNSAA